MGLLYMNLDGWWAPVVGIWVLLVVWLPRYTYSGVTQAMDGLMLHFLVQ